MLLVVLFFVGIEPIKKVVDSFRSIGETEDSKVTELKNSCNQQYKEGCALDVAKALIQTGGSSFEAQSWLRKEIQSTDNKKLLNEVLSYAQTTLYPTSQDWEGATETYALLGSKLGSDVIEIPMATAVIGRSAQDLQKTYATLKTIDGPAAF
jgi:hypothetical protein